MLYVPWPASSRHRPFPEGRAPERLSFPTLEAIIEKRNQQRSILHDHIISKGLLEYDYCKNSPSHEPYPSSHFSAKVR